VTDVLIRPSSSGSPGNLIESSLSHISFSGSVSSSGTVLTIGFMYGRRKDDEKGDTVQLNKSSRTQILLD
jgi:hypothetical protein